jgi:pimeloyl-ACP methyl ester carboxylesterase
MSNDLAEKTVDIEGLRIHYREGGQGKTVVFFHGAGGAPPKGAGFIPALAGRFRLLIPSRPGFDDSALGKCATLVDVVEVMASFIGHTSDWPVHVVAQSAGGAVGCWLAVLHPELVASLVLSAPAAFASPPAGGAVSRSPTPPTPEQIEALLYGKSPFWAVPPTPAEHERIARNAQAQMSRFGPHDGNRDLLERLHEIKAPTLVLWGTEEHLLSSDTSRIYQKHIPNSYRIYIYGAAHELPISAGPRWVNLVSDFIERGEAFVVNQEARSDDTNFDHRP